MKVLHLFPPNYAAINKAFNVRGKPVLFCYGDAIYNPSRIKVPPHLLVHEGVHSRQQATDPAGWWDRYIIDSRFRLDQEIPAHCAECVAAPHLIERIAGRLSSALYGGLIDYGRAFAILGQALDDRFASTASDGNAWPRNSAAAAI